MSDEPLLRVVRGTPTPEELAALVAVVTAGAGTGVPPEPAPPLPCGWRDRRAMLRRPVVAGPGAWTRSARVPGTRTRAGW